MVACRISGFTIHPTAECLDPLAGEEMSTSNPTSHCCACHWIDWAWSSVLGPSNLDGFTSGNYFIVAQSTINPSRVVIGHGDCDINMVELVIPPSR